MAPKMRTSVTLFGKPPWGFSVSGGQDLNKPLVISKVEAGTVAERGNLKPGDVIVAVNGESVTSLNVAQCNEKLRKANASLYLLLIKNGATVTIKAPGDVTIESSTDIYNDESSELRRLAKYNRSAKPYPGSPTLTEAPVSPPVIVKNWSEVRKPPGFRSVVFCPKVSPKTSER